MKEVYSKLLESARYSVNSCSRDLIFQTYGKAIMARELDCISNEQFMELCTMLVKNGINNSELIAIWNKEGR